MKDLIETRTEISSESAARRALEISVASAVESAVRGVANATRTEIARRKADMVRLEAQLQHASAVCGELVRGRCGRVEENLINRVAEREQGLHQVRKEVSRTTHTLLNEVARERHARTDAAAAAAAGARRAMQVSNIIALSKQLAHDTEVLTTTKLDMRKLERVSKLHVVQVMSNVDALAAATASQLESIRQHEVKHFSGMNVQLRTTKKICEESQDASQVHHALQNLVSTVVETNHTAALNCEVAQRVEQDTQASLALRSHLAYVNARIDTGRMSSSEDRALVSHRYNEQQNTLSQMNRQIDTLTHSLRGIESRWQEKAQATDIIIDVAVCVWEDYVFATRSDGP